MPIALSLTRWRAVITGGGSRSASGEARLAAAGRSCRIVEDDKEYLGGPADFLEKIVATCG